MIILTSYETKEDVLINTDDIVLARRDKQKENEWTMLALKSTSMLQMVDETPKEIQELVKREWDL